MTIPWESCYLSDFWIAFFSSSARPLWKYVLNMFIDIQTSKELTQMDTDKMMTYGTLDDEKLTQS